MKTIIHLLKITTVIFMVFLLWGFGPYCKNVLLPDAQFYTGFINDETYTFQENRMIGKSDKESTIAVLHMDAMLADPSPVPLTDDIIINADRGGSQQSHDIAMAEDGSFVACWQDDGDGNGAYQIFAAGFSANGNRRWSDITVNATSSGQQLRPSVAMAANGSFVVCWQDDNDGNGVYQIYAAGFNSNGSKRWGDITVNKVSDGQQLKPVIAMAPDGSFVVCWEDDSDQNDVYQIYAAGFNSNGSKKWSDITVNKNSDGQQTKPDIAMATNGTFTVCWQDDSDQNGVYQIYAAGFNSNGTKKWSDITVNKNSAGQQFNPAVAMAAGGSFVVSWQSDGDENGVYQILAAGFNSGGSKIWTDITVNKISTGQQTRPAVAMVADGSFTVCWEDDNDRNGAYQIFAAGFNSNGSKKWGDITGNKNSEGNQYHPLVEISTNGYAYRMAIVWETSYSNSYKTDLFGRLFRIDNKLEQTINFSSLPTIVFGDPGFNLTGIASSGLPVTFSSSNTNVATIAGNAVTITGAGPTDITASQSGNDAYNPAGSVTLTLTVQKANQSIAFEPLPSKTFGDADFYLTGNASSGLAVTYVSSNTNVATIAGNKVTITGIGSTNITASQSGNNNYNSAASVTQPLTILSATGMQETSLRMMNVYPNPTSGIVFIESEKIIDNVYIYDLQCKRMGQYHQNSQTAIIDLNHLSSGYYLIRIQCGNMEYSQKIEKKW